MQDSGSATVKMMLPHIMLIRVFFIILVQKELGDALEDNFFRPTPIPLNDWYHERRQTRAGTLHEVVATTATPSVVAIPAHYWEDALKHSVYLTLVRDKIDQLIARGEVVYPQTKPDQYSSKELDDQDLWNKIKSAPFDRLQAEEPASMGDVTIMAKGRLLEDNGRFQFIEDERTQDSCGDDKCMDGVKAFWSVKRVRQRDVETSPGRYHYELTFSVATKHKKERKPYEKPVRMFTVQETTSEKATYKHNQHEDYYEKLKPHAPRGEKSIWFHKNIAPTTPRYESRQYGGLDRIFSSLFDDYDEAPPQRSKPIAYLPQTSKAGHVGTSNEYYQQQKLTPFPYKPHSIKYFRPPIPPSPLSYSQNHYLDIDNPGNAGNQYIPQPTDNRYITSYKTSKIQRPAFLPTLPPSMPIVPPKTTDVISKKMFNTDNSSAPEVITGYDNSFKPYPTPPRINYFSEHVRPPVYNAPPGVFQNKDKKPFKPMPPFKFIQNSKPFRANRPTDFRPSPQLLDVQLFSEPDPLFDNAFRPITVRYSFENTTEETEAANENTDDIQVRKPDTISEKKHEYMKPQAVTTSSPEIITAHSSSLEENIDDPMLLASILDALTKTSPMTSQTSQAEKLTEMAESTTPMPSSTTTVSTTTAKRLTTTQTKATSTTTTTTTPRAKKRTRPPPKFTMSEKVKKHKRITSTTAVTPVEKMKSVTDLTPQASNSPGTTSKPWIDIKNTTIATTTSPSSTTAVTSTTITPTPHTTTTTTTTTHSTNPTKETYGKTTQPKNKNRYRQSTLMYKGTSVKHDKWSTSTGENATDKSRKNMPPNEKHSPRRKGSNFQGYVPSSTPIISDMDRNREVHLNSVTQSNTSQYSVEITTAKLQSTLKTTSFEETNDHENNYEMKNVQSALDLGAKRNDSNNAKEEFSNEDEESDHIEIIQETTDAPSDQEENLNKPETTTEQIVITSPLSVAKNKTKCKKKQHQNRTNNTSIENQSFVTNQPEILTSPLSIITTTQIHSDNIFDDIFGGFTDDYRDNKDIKPNATESTPRLELEEGESEHHERYVKIDDNFDDLYDSLINRENETDVEMYEDVNEKELSSDESYEDDKERSSDTTDYEETEERPFSLLELIQGLD